MEANGIKNALCRIVATLGIAPMPLIEIELPMVKLDFYEYL